MARQVAHHLPRDNRVPHKNNLPQIELLDDGGEVVRERVIVKTVPRIAGAPMAPVVVGDGAETSLREMDHLVLPHIAVQRPSMNEKDWFPGTPVAMVEVRATGSLKRRRSFRCRGACSRGEESKARGRRCRSLQKLTSLHEILLCLVLPVGMIPRPRQQVDYARGNGVRAPSCVIVELWCSALNQSATCCESGGNGVGSVSSNSRAKPKYRRAISASLKPGAPHRVAKW